MFGYLNEYMKGEKIMFKKFIRHKIVFWLYMR